MRWTHKGIEIDILGDGAFKVGGEIQALVATLKAAKELIEREERFTKRKISLAVLTEFGTATKIVGINRTDANIQIAPAVNDPQGPGTFYPDTPEVAAKLLERAEAREVNDRINSELKVLAIRRSRGYGSIDTHEYDDVLGLLESDYVAATKVAEGIVIEG